MSTLTMTHADPVEKIGRVAIATQGVLYLVVGLLAAGLAVGRESSEPSQRGAIESVAQQPYGRWLLGLLAVGLATHAAWRAVLAFRGESGDDDDAGSVAKRAANVGRALIYASFTAFAVRLLLSSGSESGGGGNTEQRSTATVLSWPGGRVLVVGAGLAVIGAGLWNARKAITRSFTDDLDLHRLDHSRRRLVEAAGVVGYLARAVVFALVGWFLAGAGLHEDAGETRTVDQSLRELAESSRGPLLLLVVAGGLMVFGAYRIVDALVRKDREVTHA